MRSEKEGTLDDNSWAPQRVEWLSSFRLAVMKVIKETIRSVEGFKTAHEALTSNHRMRLKRDDKYARIKWIIFQISSSSSLSIIHQESRLCGKRKPNGTTAKGNKSIR
jgi:hypothetical protein